MPRILLVEDDENLRELVEEWLIFDKFTVVSCSTGAEALEQLAMLNFDGIVLDWHLADLSGIEILKWHRSAGFKTPVMMLTGSNTVHDRGIAKEAGADGFVSKPFKLNELSQALTDMITSKENLNQ